MCRLFGQISKEKLGIRYWMLDAKRPLVGWSEEHGHGWGIGWYDQDKAHLEKAPGSAQESDEFQRLSGNTEASLFVCHLRKATCGEQSVCNSQPFKHDGWLFGHNGTVDRERLLTVVQSDSTTLEGDTDSEVYFRWLQRNMKERGIDGLRDGLEFVRGGEHTALNFVASDGNKLYGYWEKSPSAKTADPDYYQLYYLEPTEPESSVVICSERLDDPEWKRLPHQMLMAVDRDLSIQFVDMKK